MKRKKKKSTAENYENMSKCSSFNSCSRNLCPLDFYLNYRYGKKWERCRYMKEHSIRNIKGKTFVSGGNKMPDVSLIFVPEKNLKYLNKASQKRWLELKKKKENELQKN